MPQTPAPHGGDVSAEGSTSVLLRAFTLLDVFSRRDVHTLTLSQLARHSGLPKSTTHRVVGQLLAIGAVERHGHGYRIGSRLFSLSTRSLEAVLTSTSLPVMVLLGKQNEHVTRVLLARRSGDTVSFLGQTSSVPGGRASTAGCVAQAPALKTAEGQVLLAFSTEAEAEAVLARGLTGLTAGEITEHRRRLWEIRTHGFALHDSNVVDGLPRVAVPVIVGARPVAAVSVVFEPTGGDGRQFVEPLRSAARDIARELERHPLLVAGRTT